MAVHDGKMLPICIRTFDSIDMKLEVIKVNMQNHIVRHDETERRKEGSEVWVRWGVPIILSLINMIMLFKSGG